LSNALYDKGREAFLTGGINWVTDNIKAVLVDATEYTPNLATHQYLSDIPSGGRVATSANLAGKTATAGVADANDIAFIAAAGDPSEYMVLYKDTGTATTSALIAFIDTATGLPATPNGTDITVQFDAGANRIFKL
jgi:hypothetical protein